MKNAIRKVNPHRMIYRSLCYFSSDQVHNGDLKP